MTYQSDFTLPSELLEQIATQGFDVLPELIRIVINAAMQAERRFVTGGGLQEQILAAVSAVAPDQPATLEDASGRSALYARRAAKSLQAVHRSANARP